MNSTRGKRMDVFGISLNTILSIVALVLIVYVLFKDARDDKTASEAAVEKINEIKGEVHSRSGELDELQMAHDKLEHVVRQNGEATLEMDQRLSSEIEALKLKVGALEMAQKATRGAKFQVEPIKVEPVQLKVSVLYPKPRTAKKVDLEPVKKAIKKVTGSK